MKVYILTLSLSLILSGECAAEYNLATRQEEYLLFSTEAEIRLGRALAQKVEKRYKLSPDEQVQARLEEIGQKLVSVCARKDITYCFRVLAEEKTNAFALPGGYIYVCQGLMEKVESDDELAAILAHEIGHLVARHSIKRLQATLGYNLLGILTIATVKDARFKRGIDLAFRQIMAGYSREDELLADRLAVDYLRASGYNPQGVLHLLEKLRQLEKEKPPQPLLPAYARTHPYLPERIAKVRREIFGQMEFDDYLNIGGRDDSGSF